MRYLQCHKRPGRRSTQARDAVARSAASVCLESLEPRALFSVPAIGGVPQLSSNPSASAKLYLDFDGDPAFTFNGIAVPPTPAYSAGGDTDTTSFTDKEVAYIREIWARVAEQFSPFNLDVTTVDPGVYPDKVALKVVIGGQGLWAGGVSGGVASRGAFFNTTLANYAYCFSDNLGGYPAWVAAEIGHQAGRSFNLINTYNLYGPGATGSVYDLGTSTQSPIMGGGHFAQRENWWQGYNDHYLANQDDMAVLAGTNNGFGYRSDDYGNSAAAAALLSGSGSTLARSGIIKQTGDVDCFSFTTSGGSVTLRVDAAQYGPTLDPVVELRNSAGTLLTSADASYALSAPYPGDVISTSLSAGTYYVTVRGHGWIPETFSDGTVIGNGKYADVGQYTLTINADIATPTTPDAPTNLTATAASASQINLAWTDNSTSETGFLLDRATDSAFTQNLATTSLAAGLTTYSATALAGSTTYYFRVRATGSAGSSDNSNTASATTAALATIPAAPGNLVATAISSSQINLSWTDNSSNETGFTIDRATDSAFTQNLTTTTVGTNYTACSITGLAGSTTYYFRVRATGSAGSSANSNTAFATTAAIVTLPSAPTNLSATAASSSQINLSWTDNSTNESGFVIDRATDSAFTQNLITTAAATNSTTYSATGLAGSTTYYFRVRATGSAGSSANSNTAMASTPAIITAPSAPANLSASGATGAVMLNWTDQSSNESGFMLQRSTDSGLSWSNLANLALNTTAYSDSAITTAMTYCYRVYAYNSSASSAMSNMATILPIPATPTLSAAASSSSQINLSWNDVAGETGYSLQRSTDNINWTTITSTAAGTLSFTDSALLSSTMYCYRVCATGLCGTSQPSNTAAATTAPDAAVPSAPSLVKVASRPAHRVLITWQDNSTDETGFLLQYSSDGVNWYSLATLSANTTSYSFSSRRAYYYRVAAFNISGQSAWTYSY